MSDHNLTRCAGADADTVITTNPRPGLVSIMPEQTMAGTLTVYHQLGDAVAAYGDITAQDGGTEGDTITVGGITITLDDTPADENAIATEANESDLTTALLAALTGHSDYADEDWTVEQTGATTLRVTAKATGTAGNSIALAETGTTWVVPGTTLEFGAPGGALFHVTAAGLTQAGKYLSNEGIQAVDGLAVVRSNTADEVGITWAPGLV